MREIGRDTTQTNSPVQHFECKLDMIRPGPGIIVIPANDGVRCTDDP